jgi:hypothetical protein
MTATSRTRRTGLKARAITLIRRTHAAAATVSKALGYRACSGIIASHVATGRWIHVHVYFPLDEALYAGLRTYKGTSHLLRTSYSEAA